MRDFVEGEASDWAYIDLIAEGAERPDNRRNSRGMVAYLERACKKKASRDTIVIIDGIHVLDRPSKTVVSLAGSGFCKGILCVCLRI